MTTWPGRSLIGVKPLPPEHDGEARFLLTCDCATSADLTIQIDGPLPGSAEAAYTCDGCGTSHWFRLNAAGESPDP